jgi:hypothetical protein
MEAKIASINRHQGKWIICVICGGNTSIIEKFDFFAQASAWCKTHGFKTE